MTLCKTTILTVLFLCAGCAYAQTATESTCTEDELVKAALEDREFRLQAEREIKDEIDRKLKENNRRISVLGANAFCSNTDLYQRALTKVVLDISNSYSSGDKAYLQVAMLEQASEAIPIQVQGVATGLQMAVMPAEKKNALCRVSADLANDIISGRLLEP